MRLHSEVIPPDMSLAEILERTTREYDDVPLQVQGRTVHLGLIRQLHALMEQSASAQRYAERRP